jgi:hypothetical protein
VVLADSMMTATKIKQEDFGTSDWQLGEKAIPFSVRRQCDAPLVTDAIY